MGCCGGKKMKAGYKENAATVKVDKPSGVPKKVSMSPTKMKLVCNTSGTANPDFMQNH